MFKSECSDIVRLQPLGGALSALGPYGIIEGI